MPYPSKIEALERRLKSILLADIDMNQVYETANYLLGEHADAPGHDGGAPVAIRRVLETGLVITYARPFTDARGLQTLSRARGLPDALVETHDTMLNLRNLVFAHTDDTPFRQLRKHDDDLTEPSNWPENLRSWVDEHGGPFDHMFFEQWTLPTREALEQLRELALAHHEHFRAEAEHVWELLREERSVA